jgi:hypothetical protein
LIPGVILLFLVIVRSFLSFVVEKEHLPSGL